MLKFICPACGKKLAVPDEYAGKQVRCPACQQTMTVPQQQPEPYTVFPASPPMPPPPPPPNYYAPYPPHGYPPTTAPSNGMAVASLVLGIISFCLFCLSFIPGTLAIIFGGIAISNCNKGIAGGKGMAKAGLTCGIISMALWGIIYIVSLASHS